jgi:hypothetical protein
MLDKELSSYTHLVVCTAGDVRREHRHVSPRRWVPIRVVVALLRALVAVAVVVGLLSRGRGALSQVFLRWSILRMSRTADGNKPSTVVQPRRYTVWKTKQR